jgi:hypothetical protein
MEQQNHDQMAENYISAVENQKQSEGYTPDQSFTRGDMETCFVAGAQSMERLQEGCTGTFGQAIASLRNGFLVRRQRWNGKGMFLFMRPFCQIGDQVIVEEVKSLPWNFKEWVRHHPCEGSSRFFGQYLCMKDADGTIVNGWLASQTDMLADDWELVNPEE